MKQGYGSADSDKVGKEISDKPLNGPGSDPVRSALVGGKSNEATNTNTFPGKSNPSQGAATKKGSYESIAPYNEGGFRNAAMEHKR